MTLIEQLHHLATLAAQATEGPWTFAPAGDYDAWSLIRLADSHRHHMQVAPACDFASVAGSFDAVFIAEARNVFTPENLALLTAALAPQWVAVTERLPEIDAPVLTCDAWAGDYVRLARWTRYPQPDGLRWQSLVVGLGGSYHPTHWMALPAAPVKSEGSPAND